MDKRIWTILLTFIIAMVTVLGGCSSSVDNNENSEQTENQASAGQQSEVNLILSEGIEELEKNFSAVRYDGNYSFDEFLLQGGAASDADVVAYLADHLLSGLDRGSILGDSFGCSTITVKTEAGNTLFGRNFDWETCEGMIVETHPENGFASFSTVNMDFITRNVSGAMELALSADEVKTLAAIYAPLDGMNEAGLAVSVNMIQDNDSIDQNTDKPDITTTTAVRLLLDKATDVDEALALLDEYDMHSSMGMMIHFALADKSGRSVVVEYINNERAVIETPVVTNFYLAQGEKNGTGTQQSHERYEILTELLEDKQTMETEDVRNALDRVSKDNFDEFASTEWSVVFNLETGEAWYYHQENYEKAYIISLK